MALYALTVFLGAFLLFQVQPVLAKFLLPWFGGGAAVWTSCLLFFQVALLGGYGYAHLIRSWLPRGHRRLHAVLVGVSVLFVPIFPEPAVVRPESAATPTLQIALLLAATVGLPYLLLASTGPLVQSWFAAAEPGRSPYRLYALSNVGSLLALLSYPVLVEPLLSRGDQVVGWSWTYLVFALVLIATALRRPVGGAMTAPQAAAAAGTPPGWRAVCLWVALAATGAALLMACTNQLSQDVAAVPFLWVLPLVLYLLSFIICFDAERWYDRRIFVPLLAVAIPGAVLTLRAGLQMALLLQMACISTVLFAGCMCCHGELVRRRPAAAHLTLFYLSVAGGGALGGSLVALAAPLVFDGFWEFHVALVACTALVGVSCLCQWRAAWPRRALVIGGFAAAELVLALALLAHARDMLGTAREASRNFYGAVRVVERRDARYGATLRLYHGQTRHGAQFVDPARRLKPTTYYGPDSGIGLAIAYHPRRDSGPLEIGVVGLGVGTLAAYAGPGDRLRFYEIDPQVERMARTHFTYLADSAATIEVILGDARLQMRDEVGRGRRGRYDVLAVDAFSSDAIPIHLLTREGVELYWQLLKPDGLLALHVSNRFVDLRPVARAIARRAGANVMCFRSRKSRRRGTDRSTWLVLVRDNPAFEHHEELAQLTCSWDPEGPAVEWTDDFASLWPVLELD